MSVAILSGLWEACTHDFPFHVTNVITQLNHVITQLSHVITQLNHVFFLLFITCLLHNSNSGSVEKPPKPSRSSIGDAVTTPQQQTDEVADAEVFPTSSSSDVSH